jgi:hypothetical protein
MSEGTPLKVKTAVTLYTIELGVGEGSESAVEPEGRSVGSVNVQS